MEAAAHPAGQAAPAGRRWARVAVPVLVVVASVAILLAVLVGYAKRAVLDSDQFANRATVALRDDSVRSLIGTRVTDELVLESQSDLIAARPLIQSVVASVVGGRAFTQAFRAGVRDVHAAVVNRDQDTVTLTIKDAGTIAAAGLEAVRPALARRLDTTRRVEIVRRDIGTVSGRAARAADTVRPLAGLLALVALAAVAAALALSADRRRTVGQLGVGAVVAGLVLVVGLDVARSAVLGRLDDGDDHAAGAAVWDAFLGDLHTAGWILAACGAVVAAAAASLLRPVDLDEPLRRAAAWLTAEPQRPWAKALRAVALVAVGLWFVLDHDTVLAVGVTLTGLYLIYAGVSALLWLAYQPRPAAPPGAAAATPRAARGPRWRTLLAGAVACGLVVALAGAFLGSGGASTAAPPPGPCNGHVELCDRTLPEVALAATHNAMSVPLPGWFAAEQDRPIAGQLDDGIRGLLIDTHYADRLPNGRVRTDIGDPARLKRKLQIDGVSPQAVDAAMRLRKRLGFRGEGVRGTYLCHTFCELGATRLDAALDDLHDFLVANPGEVVVVVNQDEITPQDFVDAVREAGLAELAYRGPTTGRWWTLRQMIDRNQRVVFLAERRAGAADWYHPAYRAITEETPYTFTSAAQLTDPGGLEATCRANRGPARAPLFLVNHWVSTDPVPRPSDASRVNAYGPLLRRLRTCQRVRRHLPNLVAVNFYRRGAVEQVVDAINGVARRGGHEP